MLLFFTYLESIYLVLLYNNFGAFLWSFSICFYYFIKNIFFMLIYFYWIFFLTNNIRNICFSFLTFLLPYFSLSLSHQMFQIFLFATMTTRKCDNDKKINYFEKQHYNLGSLYIVIYILFSLIFDESVILKISKYLPSSLFYIIFTSFLSTEDGMFCSCSSIFTFIKIKFKILFSSIIL